MNLINNRSFDANLMQEFDLLFCHRYRRLMAYLESVILFSCQECDG